MIVLGLHDVLPPTSYAKPSHTTLIHAGRPSSYSARNHLAMISSTSAIAILFSLFSASICCYCFCSTHVGYCLRGFMSVSTLIVICIVG
mmetsp:Transcript_3941/g.7039  ORF Transcript_3941/g.7039 Transcript_3941/m.7039 type:complete len:89 (-) Transcript_3941:13-279(-)